MKNKIFYLSTFIFLFFTFNIHAQITRGAEENEIYISSKWYMDNFGKMHYAIFHSTDNGENISLKYENIETPPAGEMKVCKIIGDATPGVLYNYGFSKLWVSFDYGVNWNFIENYSYSGFFTSGSNEGVIYKNGTDVAGTLYFSNDYGAQFTTKNEDIKFFIEVGIEIGELYGISGTGSIGYSIKYSNNYGLDFLTIPIDSTIAFFQIGGFHPQISMGTEQGELFLVSWWPDYHYKIFRSIDTGYTWTEKFESGYIDFYYWQVKYTAGREPGSFYMMRSKLDPTYNHRLLYIDYSNDYGETFTTYFHDIDSTISSVNSIKKKALKLTSYPNPFIEKTTINFELPNNCKNPVLNICNINGVIVKQFKLTGKKKQQWDGRDNNGKLVPGHVLK